ncbi:MAG: hypothetical protein HPY71_00715 [Firmicutes bacterium]|nr:hypothetical protein [Bacillota bacterium]
MTCNSTSGFLLTAGIQIRASGPDMAPFLLPPLGGGVACYSHASSPGSSGGAPASAPGLAPAPVGETLPRRAATASKPISAAMRRLADEVVVVGQVREARNLEEVLDGILNGDTPVLCYRYAQGRAGQVHRGCPRASSPDHPGA